MQWSEISLVYMAHNEKQWDNTKATLHYIPQYNVIWYDFRGYKMRNMSRHNDEKTYYKIGYNRRNDMRWYETFVSNHYIMLYQIKSHHITFWYKIIRYNKLRYGEMRYQRIWYDVIHRDERMWKDVIQDYMVWYGMYGMV